MARIGTFKKVSGEYRGQIVTLSVQAKLVRIVPEDNPSGNAPSHRVFIGEAEVGAAWEKKSQDKRPRSEEHTSELQSLMRISYAVFCLKKKKKTENKTATQTDINQTTHIK